MHGCLADKKERLVKIYKIMHGVVDREMLFFLSHNTRTWGHPLKPKGRRFKENRRKYFSLQPAVKLLLQDVVTIQTW